MTFEETTRQIPRETLVGLLDSSAGRAERTTAPIPVPMLDELLTSGHATASPPTQIERWPRSLVIAVSFAAAMLAGVTMIGLAYSS